MFRCHLKVQLLVWILCGPETFEKGCTYCGYPNRGIFESNKIRIFGERHLASHIISYKYLFLHSFYCNTPSSTQRHLAIQALSGHTGGRTPTCVFFVHNVRLCTIKSRTLGFWKLGTVEQPMAAWNIVACAMFGQNQILQNIKFWTRMWMASKKYSIRVRNMIYCPIPNRRQHALVAYFSFWSPLLFDFNFFSACPTQKLPFRTIRKCCL